MGVMVHYILGYGNAGFISSTGLPIFFVGLPHYKPGIMSTKTLCCSLRSQVSTSFPDDGSPVFQKTVHPSRGREQREGCSTCRKSLRFLVGNGGMDPYDSP